MTTTSHDMDIRHNLNAARPDQLADILRKIKFGNMLSLIKVVVTGLTDVAGQDITTAAFKAALSSNVGIVLDTGENLPPIGKVVTLRTTAGALGTHGSHVVTDAGGTPLVPNAAYPGLATLSDDGKTLTFQAGVTAFVLEYYPRAAVALTTSFPAGAPGGD